MKNWIRNTVLMILLLLASIGRGQNYPVQAFVQLTPPYSSYLPDYSDPFNNQLKVLLTLTDFSVPSYQVKLRLRIEGQGYTIQSADLTNFPAILLSPGVPVEISGSDLAPYLATQNLIFNGIDVANYEQSKILPEGPATICIEVVDIPTGAILGNESCAQSWFYKHQTPLLNLPICGSEITPTSPQSVMFQWTPMHMSIGQNTNYQFELFKVYPEGDDPNVVVSNPFLKIADITTSNTFVLYDLTNTPLEIGEEYVWRIRASDITGRDLFNNSGYSQVCTFTYGNVAGSLLDGYNIQLNSVGTSKRQGKATWNTSGIIDEYILEVRKTGNPNYQWFPYPTTNGELKVNNLEPETEYECRVKGKLAEAETDWSNTSVFTTLAQQDYACNNEAIPGLPPVFKPASSVGTGNIVQVGQFEMIVASAQPSGIQGSFTGEGVIFIPFMMMPLAVEFENVMIDENLTVHAGRVNAITKGVAAWVNEGVTHSIPGTVDSYTSDQQDSIVVFYFGNESLEFDWPTPGNTVTVTDESNKQYVIDEYGNVTESYIIEYDSESLDATANYQVIFKEASSDQFGFDEKEYDPWTLYYPCILLSDSSKYFTSYKAIKDGQTDQVKAELISDQSATTITFKDEDGSTYSSSVAGNTYTIDLNTLSDPEYLYAYDNNGLKLGKLNLIAYEQKDIDVVLVPVNGATATNDANLTSYLNNIYRAANLNFNISTDSNFQSTFDIDGNGLQSASDEELSNYSTEMKALRDEYFDANPSANKDAMYLFVVPSFDDPTADGYMVRGKSMGFIKSGAADRTYAHELGHGFQLKHSFPANVSGSTTNLMDYSNGEDLAGFQWKGIRDFSFAFSFLDDAEDGQYAVQTSSNNRSVYKWYNENTITSYGFNSIYTPGGDIITLNNPSSIDNISFDVLTGGVASFHYGSNQYYAQYSIIEGVGDLKFIGYFIFEYQDILRNVLAADDPTFTDVSQPLPGSITLQANELKNNHEAYFSDYSFGQTGAIALGMIAGSDEDCQREIVKWNDNSNSVGTTEFDPDGIYQYPLKKDFNALLATDISSMNPVRLDSTVISDPSVNQVKKDLMCELIQIYGKPRGWAREYVEQNLAINNMSTIYEFVNQSEDFLDYIVETAKIHEQIGDDVFVQYSIEIKKPYLTFIESLLTGTLEKKYGDENLSWADKKLKFQNLANNLRIKLDKVKLAKPGGMDDYDIVLGILSEFTDNELTLLSTTDRLKCLSFLTSDWMISDKSESIANRLLATSPTTEAIALLDGLRQVPYFETGEATLFEWLIYRIDFSDYTEFWQIILEKYQYYVDDKSGAATDVYFIQYGSDNSGVNGDCADVGDCILTDFEFRANNKVFYSFDVVTGCNTSSTGSGSYGNNTNTFNNVYGETVSYEIDIYEPVLFLNNSDLNLVGDALPTGDFIPAVPAIFLKYVYDKEFEQSTYDIIEVVAVTADFLTLATGPGLIWKAVRTGKELLVVYEGMQVVASTANLALNASGSESDLVNAFNLIVGGWGIIKGGTKLVNKWTDLKSVTDESTGFKPVSQADAQGYITKYDDYAKNSTPTPEQTKLYDYLKAKVGLNNFSWVDNLSGNGWTEALKNALKADLNSNPNFFGNLNNVDGAEAWKLVRESIGNSTNNGFTKFAVDPKTLEKVSEIMQSGSSLRNKFPNTWEQEFSDILYANKDIGCATCDGTGITRVPKMDEMLDNVEHIMQFGNKPGFNTIMTNLKSNIHNRDGIHHMITYMKNNQGEFANVIEFEFRYADDIMNKADVLVGNVKYEFKSWTPDIPNPWNSFFSGSGSSYTQMIRYFENSTNINQVKYVFNSLKATESQVKNAFKSLFISRADDMFKPISQGGLGEAKMKQLFEFDNFQFQNATEFKGLFNNNQTFRDNALKFIKVD